MSTPANDSGGRAGARPSADELPPPIEAVRLRHPWRWIVSGLLIIWVIAFVVDASHREAYDWSAYGKYIFDERISKAALVTLQLTVYSMILAIVLGIILAIMRLSPNPVFSTVSWVYIWIFRGTPVYVQLVFWGLLATIYPSISVGIPGVTSFVDLPTTQAISLFWLAVIGLGLNEAAYMAEIVRSGLLSVDRGQEEAAKALGMSWGLMMRRVVLPQAMRIIIPPTGNEVISMLKTTSLVTAVPVATDLYTRSRDISSETFNPIPLLLIASTWYLFFTSILMVIQYFLEKRFARGHTQFAGAGDEVVAPVDEVEPSPHD
jgi:polar amino acid transport system permease protein